MAITAAVAEHVVTFAASLVEVYGDFLKMPK